MATIEQLYQTLSERRRPEDVAQIVIELTADGLTTEERLLLEKAAKGSLARNVFGYTSMLQVFAEAKGAGKQITKAIEIFKLDDNGKSDYNNQKDIADFINFVSPMIHKTVGKNDFKTDRLNKSQRKESGLDLSKRNYNKKWRLLTRIEKKLLKFIREGKKNEFQKIAKHGLAHTITFEDFSSDLNTACFIAYYNSRCNLRSVFTNQSQERPFDEISDILLKRCTGEESNFLDVLRKDKTVKPNSTNWWAISHIYTGQLVLSNLTDEQKGTLLGKWTTVLQDIAELLDEVWTASNINRETMVVRRGNDSTTWNNTAGAWNKARDNWMNLIYSLGLDYILEEICFGKVLRLMAADVVAWHFSTGGKLDPNTEVWNKIPLPWEVFQNKAQCNKELVVQYCEQAGIDPEKSGWIAPRVHGVAEFKPTPELVHGVTVANPFLATVLKRHRYYSGKNAKPLYPESN
ncbi:hypothetical protein [Sphingobacterium tabacisoli]|uniref:DUF5636 domain-containing protein n=1 Tax=Sphingobacterium tabacisoli TaxID=2044855 RepID=A0ABW5L735_9SPHI|nr:hypothetical protein [Sphingobacterium tabacisoli]